MPSSKNCNWGGLINISSIVSFRPPRHLFLHFFFWHLFVIIVIVWQINKIPKYLHIFRVYVRAVNPPSLQILRIDGERMIHDVIIDSTWRHLWQKNPPKRCCRNCNIWPNWFTSHQSLVLILQQHTGVWEETFDFNSKIAQIK